jgi:dihydropteroate synthase
MAKVAADAQVPWVLMHWRGHSKNMQVAATYDDVVADVNRELQRQVDVALDAGVLTENIILDPGLGFAKTGEHNWTLLRHMDKLQSLGFPVLVGASRKRFLGSLLDDRPPAGREDATAAITALSAERGAWGVRVHDVRRSADVVRVVEAWRG